MSGLWRGILSGVPRTSPDSNDNVVPLRQPSLDEFLAELRAYDAQLMDKRISIDRADRAYVQERNAAAAQFNALLKRALEARSRIAEHLKTYGMAVDFPHTPDAVALIAPHTPQHPLRSRSEPTGEVSDHE